MDAARMIQDHIAWMRAAGLSEHNCADRGSLLRRLDRDLTLGVAYTCHDELVAWLAKPKWSRQTRSTYRAHIIGFYSWAASARRLAFDPSEGLPKVRVPRGLPKPVRDDALVLILTTAKEPIRTWAKLAAYGGLRCREIALLNQEDMDERGIWINGKGDRDGRVPMHPVVWEAVKDLPPGPIAVRADGRRASAQDVSLMFWHHVRSLGVETSLHKLRHWCATEIVRRTGNVKKAQRVLRHANIANTSIYVELVDQDVEDAIAALPVLSA